MRSTRDFSWIHFSDLHIEPHPDFDSEYAKEQLIAFLTQETGNRHFTPDYIFITGDVAHKGNYGNVTAFMTKLFAALKWSPNNMGHIFWVSR